MHARATALGGAAPRDLERDPDYRFLCDALADELFLWVLRSDPFRQSKWQ
jgi:hypothetical protein